MRTRTMSEEQKENFINSMGKYKPFKKRHAIIPILIFWMFYLLFILILRSQNMSPYDAIISFAFMNIALTYTGVIYLLKDKKKISYRVLFGGVFLLCVTYLGTFVCFVVYKSLTPSINSSYWILILMIAIDIVIGGIVCFVENKIAFKHKLKKKQVTFNVSLIIIISYFISKWFIVPIIKSNDNSNLISLFIAYPCTLLFAGCAAGVIYKSYLIRVLEKNGVDTSIFIQQLP